MNLDTYETIERRVPRIVPEDQHSEHFKVTPKGPGSNKYSQVSPPKALWFQLLFTRNWIPLSPSEAEIKRVQEKLLDHFGTFYSYRTHEIVPKILFNQDNTTTIVGFIPPQTSGVTLNRDRVYATEFTLSDGLTVHMIPTTDFFGGRTATIHFRMRYCPLEYSLLDHVSGTAKDYRHVPPALKQYLADIKGSLVSWRLQHRDASHKDMVAEYIIEFFALVPFGSVLKSVATTPGDFSIDEPTQKHPIEVLYDLSTPLFCANCGRVGHRFASIQNCSRSAADNAHHG